MKKSAKDLALTALAFEPLTKKCLRHRLSENNSLEELSTYGEIQAEWHEGAPDWAFAPPN